jgi:hypothetical protein
MGTALTQGRQGVITKKVGALGTLQPGTVPIFGGQGLDYDTAVGWRVSAGGWIGSSAIGGEVSAFQIRTPREDFAIASDSLGQPPLFLSAFNPTTNAEGSLIVSDPLQLFSGGVAVTSRSQLCGWEANALIAASRGDCCEIDLIAGYRYLDLEENLTVQNRTRDLILGTLTTFGERFQTDNEFHGAQVGVRATCGLGCFYVAATGKIAAGWTRSIVEVFGVTTQSAPPPLPAGTFPGGFYTMQTNTGRQTDTACTIVPELNLRVGCDLKGCVRVFVGYDCLYWSRVARPGDQIDRAINATQSPVFGGGTLVGIQRPAPLFRTTDFVAQGISAGIELRY